MKCGGLISSTCERLKHTHTHLQTPYTYICIMYNGALRVCVTARLQLAARGVTSIACLCLLPPASCCPWIPFALLSLQAFHYSLFVAVSTFCSRLCLLFRHLVFISCTADVLLLQLSLSNFSAHLEFETN